jgi:cell volume regulation protein A
MSDGSMILVAGALLALGILATLLAGRLRVPGLVLFLLLGMIIGSDGLGLIQFDDPELTGTIGVVALSLILFEGGLAAGWDEVRPVLGVGISLATVGTALTAAITGLAAYFILRLDPAEALLLGSVVAATDSAAIFSVLRGSTLGRRLARTLEAESGLNDPVAIVLVLGAIELVRTPAFDAFDLVLLVAIELAIGAVVGLALGRLAVAAFQRAGFATSGLYPVASIAVAALTYGAADVLGGSGFMAVYLAGLALGSGNIPASRTIGDFHDGVAWVSQIVLFLTLGLLVFPHQLVDIAPEALLVTAALVLLARPIAAIVATRVGRFTLREALLVGWAGLRGAVPVVLATFPVTAGLPQADRLFNIVFFVVLVSALLQGATFEPLARVLGLTGKSPALPRQPLVEVGTIRRLGAEVLEYPVSRDDAVVGRVVNELGLPREALVSFVVRRNEALLPRGSTQIEAGDRLHILVRAPVREQVRELFERWSTGPVGEAEAPVTGLRGSPAIFTVRAWSDSEGDPGDPERVGDTAVARRLRTRRGAPGALVQLADGRFAVTGDGVAAVGGSRQLFRYCRERIRRADDPQSRAWWQEIAGVLSQRALR